MKPISKMFAFSGSKTLKVREDGLYEWCGKLLGRDECVMLDYAALLRNNEFTFARYLKELVPECELFGSDVRSVTEFVHWHWVWIKGS